MNSFSKAILLCGVAAMGICAQPALAKNLKSELAQKKQAQIALEKKSKELVGQVDALKAKLVAQAKSLRDIETQVAESDKTLKELQTAKAEALQRLYKEHDALGGLLAAAGKYNRTPTPQLLLLAKPIDAARAALVMKTLIPSLQEHAAELKSQVAEMGRIEKQISEHRAGQSAQLAKYGKERDDMSLLLQERQTVYKKTEEDRKQYEKDVAQLAKEARTLAELERKIQQQAERERVAKKLAPTARLAALPSNMVQPVSGTVTTSFGEEDELGARSEGITYAARDGAVVVTPLAGKVKFAGPFQKYRQILIVEHAGGYHSLIAGLGRIDTVVGAQLAAGEPVGSAGSDTKIYYELRRGGEPVNPRNSMVAQRKQDKI